MGKQGRGKRVRGRIPFANDYAGSTKETIGADPEPQLKIER